MDTWGISGPDFLVFYVVLLLLAMVAARLARRLLGPTDASDGAGLGPYEAALLNGGEGLALNAAFASLHGDGHITAPRAGEVEVGPTPLQQAHPLERALLGTLRAGPRRVKDVRAELASCPELSAMRDTLEQQELLPGPDGRASARAVMVAIFVPLLALAFARIYAGATNDRPIAILVLLTLVTLWILWRRLPRAVTRTRRGDHALSGLRSSHDHLNLHEGVRSGATVGLVIGLFGTPALWAADPAMAASLGLPRVGSGSGSGSGSGGDGGGGCGGGCGG